MSRTSAADRRVRGSRGSAPKRVRRRARGRRKDTGITPPSASQVRRDITGEQRQQSGPGEGSGRSLRAKSPAESRNACGDRAACYRGGRDAAIGKVAGTGRNGLGRGCVWLGFGRLWLGQRSRKIAKTRHSTAW